MSNYLYAETKKLFYKKYLYKVEMHNSLNQIFRSENQKSKKLDYARDAIDELAQSYRNGLPLLRHVYRTTIEIPVEDYLDAKDLYTILKNQTNYTLRVENGKNINLYTNDKGIVELVQHKLRSTIALVYKPAPGTTHFLNENNILVETKPEFPIRVYFKDKKIPPDFANWLRANRDKARIGDKALQTIDDNHNMANFYFHVRDEKVLSIVQMLVGHAILNVYNLLYLPPTIDK